MNASDDADRFRLAGLIEPCGRDAAIGGRNEDSLSVDDDAADGTVNPGFPGRADLSDPGVDSLSVGEADDDSEGTLNCAGLVR